MTWRLLIPVTSAPLEAASLARACPIPEVPPTTRNFFPATAAGCGLTVTDGFAVPYMIYVLEIKTCSEMNSSAREKPVSEIFPGISQRWRSFFNFSRTL